MSENHVSKSEQEESITTPDEVILQWFLQPGNFARYLLADGRFKHSTGSKGAMALQVIEQLQASGNDAPEKTVMILRLTAWQKTLFKAHQLATSGLYDEQAISRVCPYYYRVADVLGPVINNMPGGNTSTDHVTSSRTTPSSTPIPSILPSPLGHQTTPSYLMPLSCRRLSFQGDHRLLFRSRRYSIDSQQPSESNDPIAHQHNQPLNGLDHDQQLQSHSNSDSNDPDPQEVHVEQNTNSSSSHQQIIHLLYQQNQELVEQQGRMHRIQEMESQAALIKEMKTVGFSNQEILQNLKRLHDNGNN